MSLTDVDKNFIGTASEEDLRNSLAFARAQEDTEYAEAIARELLQRQKERKAQ
jgi:hypothetical protein